MSNRTSVINNTLEGFAFVYAELDKLDKKATLTLQEERQRVTLLSKAAAMRSGISLDEINRAHLASLTKELGITENEVFTHRVRDPRALADWSALVGNVPAIKRKIARGEIRANLAGTQSLTYTELTEGGAFVPYGYDDRLNMLMAKYAVDEIIGACTEFETGSGNPMATPQVDDFATTGSSPVVFTDGASTIIAENTLSTGQDIKVSKIAWKETPTWRSGMLTISLELFEDAQYGVEGVAGLVEAVVAKRHAAGLGQAMITGAGLSGGLLPTLPAGQIVTSTASSLALPDFISVYSQLGPQYRKQAVWFMHSNTQIALYKLLQTSGRVAAELPTSFMGRPIAIANSMNAQGAGVPNVVVLADPGYLQKRVAGAHIQRYVEAPGLAESASIGFEGFMRADFNVSLFDSPNPPVASLSQHA